MNITLSIDEEIVKKVRKIAVDKDTTLTAMVRDSAWTRRRPAPVAASSKDSMRSSPSPV